MKKIVLIGGMIVIVAAVGAVVFAEQLGLSKLFKGEKVSSESSLDVALNYYDRWLDAVQSTTTDPYAAGLFEWKTLTDTFKARLAAGEVISGEVYGALDSVLCQTIVPERLKAKQLYEDAVNGEAKVLVFSKTDEPTGEAIVTLRQEKTGWHIDDVLCSRGEFDVPREFTFEQEGHLLKSVPEPYDDQFWHVVFTQNGEAGHVAPLYFSETSECVTAAGESTVCTPDTFTEASYVRVQGEMSEYGVDVKRVTFL